MYGRDEMAERLLLEAIAAVDGCLERWWTECQKPRDRDATASMYAEIAHRLGWLELDRTLSQAEFERLNWSRLPPDQLPPGKHRLADRVGRRPRGRAASSGGALRTASARPLRGRCFLHSGGHALDVSFAARVGIDHVGGCESSSAISCTR